MLVLNCILLIVMLLFIIRSKRKLYDLKIVNEIIESKNESYRQEIKNYKIFKHNLLSDFLALKDRSDKEVNKIISELINKYQKCNIRKDNFKKVDKIIGSNLLKFILIIFDCYKDNAINLKIENELTENYDIKLDSKKYLSLCNCINILINNACEGCLNSKEKLVYIRLYNDKKSTIIEIFNTYNNNIDLSQFGDYKYSTKKRNSGFGVYSIIENRENVHFSIKNNMFCVKLKINL